MRDLARSCSSLTQLNITIKESVVRVAVMYSPREVGVEGRPDPKIVKPTDAILRLSATCICGSDLWPYWGVRTLDGPSPMG